MNNFFQLSQKDRIEIINQAVIHKKLPRMLDTPIAEKALNDTELYKHIIAHRKIFIGLTEFDYNTLLPQTINIVPPESVIAKWEDDYNKMQTMIYGESPTFKKIIDKIKELNTKINRIFISFETP